MRPPRLTSNLCRVSTESDAFSLIELLVTMGVLAVLLSATLPALLGSQKASALTQTGNTLADMTSLAKQNALSKNTITALVIVKKGSSPAERQGLKVMEVDAVSGEWKEAGGWVRLPEAANVVDIASDNTVLAGNAKAANIAPLNLRIGGTTLQDGDYSALVFYPDGRMENNAEPSRRLSARFSSATPGATSDSLSNYYDLVVNSNTSAIRIVRK